MSKGVLLQFYLTIFKKWLEKLNKVFINDEIVYNAQEAVNEK